MLQACSFSPLSLSSCQGYGHPDFAAFLPTSSFQICKLDPRPSTMHRSRCRHPPSMNTPVQPPHPAYKVIPFPDLGASGKCLKDQPTATTSLGRRGSRCEQEVVNKRPVIGSRARVLHLACAAGGSDRQGESLRQPRPSVGMRVRGFQIGQDTRFCDFAAKKMVSYRRPDCVSRS